MQAEICSAGQQGHLHETEERGDLISCPLSHFESALDRGQGRCAGLSGCEKP